MSFCLMLIGIRHLIARHKVRTGITKMSNMIFRIFILVFYFVDSRSSVSNRAREECKSVSTGCSRNY